MPRKSTRKNKLHDDLLGEERCRLEGLILELTELLECRDQEIRKHVIEQERLVQDAEGNSSKTLDQLNQNAELAEMSKVIDNLRQALLQKERARYELEVRLFEMVQSGSYEIVIANSNEINRSAEYREKVDSSLESIRTQMDDLSRLIFGHEDLSPTVPFRNLASEARRRAHLTNQVLTPNSLLRNEL